MMERKMRRFRQQLSEENCIEILRSATAGVLALCGHDMHPYGVPLSHVYADGKLYFHSALTGHKVDLLSQNPMACFTVIAQDDIHPETYTTYFKSVIAFGTIRIIDDEAEKIRAIELLGRRCNPDDDEGLKKEIARNYSRCMMLELTIERLSGKQSIELVNQSL
ncbi:MAG: pyridoxamine 5'-phosphate oxidase family protein [Muribaculaceae bacterium]|nr:pyridoxamine 5'-phosphate oxidase family protein [Muribaculaceae bacterium]